MAFVSETIFETVNQEADRIENKKPKRSASVDLSGDCILQGYLLKLGGPFLTQWQKKYFHLFPNRLEWRAEPSVSCTPELLFFVQVYVPFRTNYLIIIQLSDYLIIDLLAFCTFLIRWAHPTISTKFSGTELKRALASAQRLLTGLRVRVTLR